MTDIFTPEKRSRIMSGIRHKDTKIEIKMADMMGRAGIGFRRHPDMYGHPDFLVGRRTAVFCDGDFWHGYQYDRKKKPRKKFWRDKIERNMGRDEKVTRKLRRNGYSVIRIWEHDIEKRPDVCLNRIVRFMR